MRGDGNVQTQVAMVDQAEWGRVTTGRQCGHGSSHSYLLSVRCPGMLHLKPAVFVEPTLISDLCPARYSGHWPSRSLSIPNYRQIDTRVFQLRTRPHAREEQKDNFKSYVAFEFKNPLSYFITF